MSFNTGIGTRTAVVTGAGTLTGIGFHTAKRFAQEGWAVAMIDVNAGGLEQAASAVRHHVEEAQVATFIVDVTDPDAIEQGCRCGRRVRLRWVRCATSRGFPAPALPSHPAGVGAGHGGEPDRALPPQPGVRAPDDRGRVRTGRQHVVGDRPARGRRVLQDGVRRRQGGCARPDPRDGARARRARHHVNAVAPGVVNTDIRVGSDQETERALAAAVPLKRQARPEEVAALFVWLSCEDSAYITGTTQSINGGTYVA